MHHPSESHDSNRAFRDLEETFPTIIRALEHGLIEASEHFDKKEIAFDGHAHSMLARLHARDYLRRHKIGAENIEDDTPSAFAMETVSLCGLWMRVDRYQIKIWKISPRELEKSLERQNRRFEQLPLVDGNGIPMLTELAIYWTVDEAQQLDRIYLVQPKIQSSSDQRDPRHCDWAWSRNISEVTAPVEPVDAGDVPIEEHAPLIKRNT